MKKKNDLTDEQQLRVIISEIVKDSIEETKPKWADKMLTLLDLNAGQYKKIDEAR